MSKVSTEAYVTLATNDSYALGALVLAHSLRGAGTTRMLVCMITPGVSQGMRCHLSGVFDEIEVVDVMDSKDADNLVLAKRPDLGITFTKLHCWKLTRYAKAVFMDADCLVRDNIDDLFEREELSAAPDIGWPDCFNSGVFVFQPSVATYHALVELALTQGSFDGGDQGLLNLFFSDWATADIKKHLPFVYNMSASITYTYAPAYKKFGGAAVKVVHFLGSVKPWHHAYDTARGAPTSYPGGDQHPPAHLAEWWAVFMTAVQPRLEPAYGDFASGGIATLTVPPPAPQPARDESEWQRAWEQGRIDYLGADSFDNIMKKLSETLADVPPAEGATPTGSTPSAPGPAPGPQG